MLVKYYKNENLKYTSRKRFKFLDSNILPIKEEEQYSILLGDGANTSIKTSVNNICDYVTIDNTRWFVTSYTYINGGQVRLNLQRDVVGEFGISSYFGNIERGYTDTILQYRKELSLNQILKNRIPLRDLSSTNGKLTKKELKGDEIYGILYLSKKGDKDDVIINIPEFAPPYSISVDNIPENGSFAYSDIINTNEVFFYVRIDYTNPLGTIVVNREYYSVAIDYIKNKVTIFKLQSPTDVNYYIRGSIPNGEAYIAQIVNKKLNKIKKCIPIPSIPNETTTMSFINLVKDSNILSYNKEYYDIDITSNRETKTTIGDINEIEKILTTPETTGEVFIKASGGVDIAHYIKSYTINTIYLNKKPLNESGSLTINLKMNFIDEPYYILAVPLCSGTYNIDGEDYIVNKSNAFSVFNKVIESLSGENGYLVDAQIYPYCPTISKLNSSINKIPFLEVLSTQYDTICKIKLDINNNIKKEYIEKTYSIISPEKSGKFDFNYYDYNKKEDVKDNLGELNIKIKTALKPFAIISSAVIQPTPNSLIGLTYDSDLRGCQPSSNGFECSIASNAFETYKRQNSNYQQIFALQQGQLQREHDTERVNEKTSAIVNTISGTFMGAVAGGSLGVGSISKAIGAGVGGAIVGTTVGTAMGIQYQQNEKLREYEEYLQKQKFNLDIGTIKNLPNTVSRISSFNEIITKDFYYVIEVYECSEDEKNISNTFIDRYGYGIGVFGEYKDFYKSGYFIRGTLVTSNLQTNLHNIAVKEIAGGIYYNDTE